MSLRHEQVRVGPVGVEVARRLLARRKEIGHTQTQVADAASVVPGARFTAAALGEIEKGMRRVDVDDLMRLARALGTSTNYLLHGDLDEVLASDSDPYDQQVQAALELATSVESLVTEYRTRVRSAADGEH